jgi:hypothetical protein
MNPMQLVWVQTNVKSERYRVMFKMTNKQKKGDVDCTVRTDADVAGHTTHGRQLLEQLACDMVCCQRMGWRHVAQSMAATCHLFIGLKSLHLAGVDPVTSGQGKALGKAAQTACPHMLLNMYMHCNIFNIAKMYVGA